MASVSRKFKRNAREQSGAPRGHDPMDIAEALYKHRGHVSNAAGDLGLSSMTVYREIRKKPGLQALRAEIDRAIAMETFGQRTLREMINDATRRRA